MREPKRQRRLDWPKIRKRANAGGSVSWLVDLRIDGRGERRFFDTKQVAVLYAEQARIKRRNEGNGAFALPEHLRIEATQAAEKLNPYDGETVTKAVDFYLAHCLRFRNAPIVAEIVKEFVQERHKLNQRDRNLADVHQRLTKFARAFGTRKLAEITVEELSEWLRDPTWSARTQIHYRRRVSMLFDYGIKRRWCEVNTASLIDTPQTEDKDVETFSVEECARILEHAEHPGCLPLVALSLFCGLRRAEVCRLDWCDVKLPARTIALGSAAAKKRSRRVVTINDTAAAWLALCAKPRGRVITDTKQELDERIKELAKLARLKTWIQNGLRHAYCSYHVAAYKDPVRTAFEAGNSAEVVQRHYRALASEADAQHFWALRPATDAGEKIVAMQG